MKHLIRSFSTPFAFLAVCITAYGLLIPWLGFYWDDLPFLWFSHTLGPGGLIEALAGDRPFLAAIYTLTTSLLGQQPLTWQIFAVLTRWLMVLALWWALLQIWLGQRRAVTWTALVFAVYPGFQQSWIAVIYSQAFLLLAAFFISIGIMVKALRVSGAFRSRQYWLLTFAAMLLSAFAFFSTEYFFGLELIRPVIIWFVLLQTIPLWRARILPTALHWLPYLAEFVLFFLYRVFLSPDAGYPVKALDELSTGFAATLIDRVKTAVINAFTGGWAAWRQIFTFPFSLELDWNSQSFQLFTAVVLLSLIILLYSLFRFTSTSAESDSAHRWSHQAILLGMLGLLAASLPFWAGGLPLSLTFPYDRFNLAMMFGASLLLVGLLEFFIRTLPQKMVLLALVLSLAIGYQFKTANTFRRDWENMKSLMWQITWRMPALEPGTMLLTHEFPLKYYSDNSLSAMLNWIYAPDNHTREMPYILNYITVRLKGSLPGLEPNLPINQRYRAMRFVGSTSQSVVLSYSPPGCLRVLDTVYSNDAALPGLNFLLAEALPLSKFDRITADPPVPARPPERWFGIESTRSWCHYFEKADLARSQGDWQTVTTLYDQALELKLKPGDQSEWMVFMEGFAHSGDWERALALGARMMQNEPQLKEGVCQAWERILRQTNPDPAALEAVQTQQADIGCAKQAKP